MSDGFCQDLFGEVDLTIDPKYYEFTPRKGQPIVIQLQQRKEDIARNLHLAPVEIFELMRKKAEISVGKVW